MKNTEAPKTTLSVANKNRQKEDVSTSSKPTQNELTPEQRELKWLQAIQNKKFNIEDQPHLWKLINHNTYALRSMAEDILKENLKQFPELRKNVLTFVENLGKLSIHEQMSCAVLVKAMDDFAEKDELKEMALALAKLPKPADVYYKANELFTQCVGLVLSKIRKDTKL